MRESAKNGTFERCLTAAKTAAKTIASYRHARTELEYRPSRRTQLDGSGRSAYAYGSDAPRSGCPGIRASPDTIHHSVDSPAAWPEIISDPPNGLRTSAWVPQNYFRLVTEK